jgi:hypothetical protein
MCREPILRSAKKCKHCGEYLSANKLSSRSAIVLKPEEEDDESKKRILPALLLCFFFGTFGFHSFYAGRSGQGVLLLCMWLLILVGSIAAQSESPLGLIVLPAILFISLFALVDFIRLIVGSYKDGEGKKISKW